MEIMGIYRAQTDSWYLERVLWLMGGLFILGGIVLAILVDLWWLLLPVLVGLNLALFGVTGFCPMAILLKKLGIKPRLERS